MSEISSHPFVPAGEHDSRSPCPALNALANHSYLHHDGRKLTVPDLIRTMREVYHISLPLASILSVLGALICGNGWSFDLEDLAKHNKIEHDGSLAHADAAPGYLYAPSVPDKELLDKLLSLSSDGRYITFEDFVRERADRDEGLSKPLSGAHNIIARGEIALTCQFSATKRVVSRKNSCRNGMVRRGCRRVGQGPRAPLVWSKHRN